MLSFGSTCDVQLFQQVLVDEAARHNKNINFTCATFQLGFEPCVSMPRFKPLFEQQDIKYNGKCAIWESEMYDYADIIYVMDDDNLQIAK